MGIAELFEIGFFSLIWNWSAPFAAALIYACILGGGLLQIVLQKKCKKTARWLLIGACGIGAIICECVWHSMTGWERLGLVFIYGYIICMMLGAVITAVILSVRSKCSRVKEEFDK